MNTVSAWASRRRPSSGLGSPSRNEHLVGERVAPGICQWLNKDSKPSLMISMLEALAVLLALKVYYSDVAPKHRTKLQVWTDNRAMGPPWMSS